MECKSSILKVRHDQLLLNSFLLNSVLTPLEDALYAAHEVVSLCGPHRLTRLNRNETGWSTED